MNLDQIATKCFILALFIRDDGERLLLGDGYYDFNQKLQHFQGNTIANDIVEIQGDNGQLLAGQVMRSGAQKFEGYIGDATTSRQIIEQKRSDFMAFFRIKHFYKVVYIFPDGTAIQRQRGYLTDAPTIPEIFQKFPEYSIALNFEDANYYEYAEDEHGDEIYAHIAELALSGNATGGLIWDAIGAVSNGITWSGIQTAQGEYISITNELDIPAKLASVEMLGKATQSGTPTPDAPVAVQTVTGENTVKIEGKNLLKQLETATSSGISATYNADGSLRLFGTATTTLAINAPFQKLYIPSGTYTFGIGTTLPYRVALTIEYADGTQEAFRIASGYSSATLTLSSTVYRVRLSSDIMTNGTAYDNTIYPQLELGSTATAYEPYQVQEFEVNLGKNLLPIASTTRTNTRMGITITLADDGLITLDGTATGNLWPDLIYGIQNNTTTHSECYQYYAQSNVVFSAKVVGGTKTTTAGGITVAYNDTETQATIPFSDMTQQKTTNSTNGINRAYIYIANGSVFNNYSFYLQVEKGSTATTFAPYFTPIELAKIGTYQDRIYKDDGKWYVEKQVGKVVLDGTEDGWDITGGGNGYRLATPDIVLTPSGELAPIMSDYYTVTTFSRIYNANIDYGIANHNSNHWLAFRNKDITSLANFKTWLSTHPTTVYYALATPTTTEITNEALIAQLEALESASLYVGANNIGTETLNAVPTLKIEYYTEYTLEGAGYEWEPGGNTAKTIVTVAGVDSAWPIWTVQGGAQNPTLTNITTGQTITWQGFVPAGQTLTINMAEMTADLAGANVFEYITGEWIRLAPGNNTLVYTAGSADKPSTLSWNGVLA